MAARAGGDADMNAALRLAIQKAHDSNMPNANIERAIQRAIGGGDGAMLEEVTYEGYAPGGAAVLIQAVTDNRNRTVADIRTTLTRGGGAMADSGSVAWQFELRGVIAVDIGEDDPDDIPARGHRGGRRGRLGRRRDRRGRSRTPPTSRRCGRR